MKRTLHISFLSILFFSCSQNLAINSKSELKVEISDRDILEHIKYLSSDELEGRYPGSKGSDLAIDYIATDYKRSRLSPLGSDDYLQFFDFTNQQGEKIKIPNVVGMVPGTTLKDEYIVIGAHFDHLGYGGAHSGSLEMNSSAIHNGADDNASGIAGMLELASKLSSERKKIKRSLIFIAFNAEEQGIFGSKYFVKNSPVNTSNIITMINLDMIGRLNNLSLNISGTGTSPLFNNILDKISKKHYLNINKNPEGFGPSDHSSFYSNNIPVLFFFTGGHSDYHKPSDDWNKINSSGQKKIVDMIYDVVLEIDNNTKRPKFTEAGPKSMSSPGRVKLKVTFGFMPSYSSTGKGLGVDGVRTEGPAGKAGLVKGDIILEINGEAIKDIYGYMEILEKLKPGESSEVKVLRNNNEITLRINH
ncbi:MAG: M20/M25/M40 family metallo-hydrolase [Candidatus Marinimicrobia bacterium]|nr:M20/M25/M40 family metallo-hydrolase [Candidatus Neomarinimicrobiota bacterium]